MVSPSYEVVKVLTVGFIFSLTFLPPRSDGRSIVGFYGDQSEKVLGSRPPSCVNKCFNCRPCTATLFIPPHPKMHMAAAASRGDGEEDSYYLLSWKCKCGNKLFQP